MNKTKLVILILFSCLILVLVTGCSNNEINNMMVIDSIGISKENNSYDICFNTYIGNDEYESISTNVKTLDFLFENIYMKVSKKIYLSHLNILYLSSNLSNDEIKNIVNNLNNRNDLRGSFLVIMVSDYDKNILNKNSLDVLELINNNHNEIGNTSPTSFNEIISSYLDLNLAYIPIIDKNYNLIGSHSLFDEYRFYNIQESKYLNLLHDNINNMNINIDNQEIKLKDINVIYKVNDNKIQIKIYFKYISNLDKEIIEKYLYDDINMFIKLDVSNNFYRDLIKKYDYDFYNNNKFKVLFDVELILEKDNISNSKEDNLIEKN